MHIQQSPQNRLLAIGLYRRGFGYTIIEGRSCLVDWGLRSAIRDKTHETLIHLEHLISRYKPDLLILEDCPSLESRRCKRIQALMWSIIALASTKKLKVYRFSRERVRKTFQETGMTKQAIAIEISRRFPELKSSVPPKRKPWKSEPDRMNIFCAIALAFTYLEAVEKFRPQ